MVVSGKRNSTKVPVKIHWNMENHYSAINIRQQSVNGSPNWIGLSSSPDVKKPESGHLKRKDWGHESVLIGLSSPTAAESSKIA